MATDQVKTSACGSAVPAVPQPLVLYNLVCLLLFEGAWGLAISMSHRDMVMARYLKHLDMPSLVVALVPVIFTLGLSVVQPLSATLVHDTHGRTRRMALIYILMSACFLLMGGSIFLPESFGGVGHLVPYLGAYVGAMICMGFGEPHYTSLVYQTSPSNIRGRIFTLCLALMGLGGIAGGWICKQVLGRLDPPASYGVLTLATGVGLAGACVPLILINESRLQIPTVRPATFRTLIRRRLPHCLGRPGFVAYLAACTGLWVLLATPPFVTNYIRSRLPGQDESFVGNLTMVMYGMMTVGSLAAGWLADRIGFRLFLICGLLLIAAGYGGLAWLELTESSALGCYAVTMLIWPVLVVGGTPYLCSIVPNVRVAEIVAVVALLTCLPRVVIPLGLGYLRDRTGSYIPLLWCVVAIALLTAVMVHLAGRNASTDPSENLPE